MKIDKIRSDVLNKEMNIAIYVPEEYKDVNLPVLYFFHGRTGNENILQQIGWILQKECYPGITKPGKALSRYMKNVIKHELFHTNPKKALSVKLCLFGKPGFALSKKISKFRQKQRRRNEPVFYSNSSIVYIDTNPDHAREVFQSKLHHHTSNKINPNKKGPLHTKRDKNIAHQVR